ncbi:hypothetical protein C8J57DRAFT_639198 [Mycena rebaudengoi]|nr:hypothetical protein C8J57DRAFT_639198 [Mycena rebaudengoi]
MASESLSDIDGSEPLSGYNVSAQHSSPHLCCSSLQDPRASSAADFPRSCSLCIHHVGVHRCRDWTCIGDLYLCEPCLVRTHQGFSKILHVIESWNGSYFQVRGLKGFGVRLQLGHPTPECCPNPVPDNTFRIIDYHYRHHVALDYCGCCSHSQYDQLINARLLPSLTRTSRATVFDLGFPDFIMREMERYSGQILIDDHE